MIKSAKIDWKIISLSVLYPLSNQKIFLNSFFTKNKLKDIVTAYFQPEKEVNDVINFGEIRTSVSLQSKE